MSDTQSQTQTADATEGQAPHAVGKRDVVMEYLCLAVGVLRAREGGDRPDQDPAADVPGMLALCEQDAPELAGAVKAVAEDDATSQAVLKLLPDDDRTGVLRDVAWNVVSWYLVDAVGELRGREADADADTDTEDQDREEVDLAAKAAALEKTLRDRKLIKAADPWCAAVNLAQTEGATSEGVLGALGEDERADVLGKVAEMTAEPVEATEAEDEQETPAERAVVAGRVAERVREAAELLGSKCQLTRAREDLATARDAYLQGAADIKAQIKELESKRAALSRAHRNTNRKVEDAAARRHNRRNLVAGAINELDGLAQQLADTDPHAAGHVFAAINVVKKDPDSPAAAEALRGLLG